ncbi:MAG: hypothetical protein ISR65_12450 [Bacteriovoracaceae bacterium]|nr:hypothetical protein [Bacteriovoracaceae bacterium]
MKWYAIIVFVMVAVLSIGGYVNYPGKQTRSLATTTASQVPLDHQEIEIWP